MTGTPPAPDTLSTLQRIADALERLAPPVARAPDLRAADAFVWRSESLVLEPVSVVSRVDISLLKAVDLQRDQLLDNSRRFADGLPANNACCGARAAWARAR